MHSGPDEAHSDGKHSAWKGLIDGDDEHSAAACAAPSCCSAARGPLLTLVPARVKLACRFLSSRLLCADQPALILPRCPVACMLLSEGGGVE